MKRLWYFAQGVLGILFRHPVVGTSIIARLADGRIVLIRRRDNGMWSLPGGMVSWGEDLSTTIHRELTEETGLEVVKILRLVGIYSAPDRDPRLHSICVVAEVEAQGTLKPQDVHEVMEVEAFHPGALPKKLSHDHDRQLQDYLNGLVTLA